MFPSTTEAIQQRDQQHHQQQTYTQQSYFNSYQQQQQQQFVSNVPNVHPYEEIDTAVASRNTYATNGSSINNPTKVSFLLSSIRGDASINPNVGLTNSYEYALFGLAPNELIDYHQKGIIILSLCTAFLIILTTVIKRFLHPAQLILSFYLVFLVLVLAISDTINYLLYNPNTNPQQQQRYEMIVRNIREFIINNFGLLLYPFPGRVFYLCICSTLCVAIGGILEFVFGMAYFLSACITYYCWMVYPEYRKTYEMVEEQFFKNLASNIPITINDSNSINSTDTRSWSSYQQSGYDLNSSFTLSSVIDDEEKLSLMRSLQESYQQKVSDKKQKQRLREQQFYQNTRRLGLFNQQKQPQQHQFDV